MAFINQVSSFQKLLFPVLVKPDHKPWFHGSYYSHEFLCTSIALYIYACCFVYLFKHFNEYLIVILLLGSDISAD